MALVLLVVGAALVVHTLQPAWYVRLWHPLDHTAVIRAEAERNGLPPALVAAVIDRESGFDPDARSAPGAVGLMQVMPETARWIATRPEAPAAPPDRLDDPAVNIAYGTWYLRYLSARFPGDRVAALAAYNAGETHVAGWIRDAEARGATFTVADIRFPETRAFVTNVLERERDYRRAYASELGIGD